MTWRPLSALLTKWRAGAKSPHGQPSIAARRRAYKNLLGHMEKAMLLRLIALRGRALLNCLLVCSALGVSGQTFAQTPVYLQATTPDAVGRQLVFELREALRRSAGMSLAERKQDALFYMRLVTLDPNNGSSAGYSTVYSAVITFQTFHTPPVEMYLTNYVGTCGQARISSCAQSLLAGVDAEAASVRAAIGELLDSK